MKLSKKFPMKLFETIALVVRKKNEKKILGQTGHFRHCETTPGAHHGEIAGVFGVTWSYCIKLYS